MGPPPTSCQKRSVFPRSHTKNLSAPWPGRFSNFWVWALIFFILALYAFLSFYFGLLGLQFSFSASILAFGASILLLRALRGGILWLFVSFWAFRGVSFCSLRLFEPSGGYPSQLRASDRGPPPHKLPKTARCPKVPYKEFSSAVAESIFQFLGLWALLFFILALCAFISFHFGLLGLHFSFSASILAFGASILPLWALRRGILWLFVSFWALRGVSFYALRPFEPSGGPSQLRASGRRPPPHKLPKTVRFPKVPYKEFISAVAGSIFQFLGLWALIFFILALYAFISFHFGLLGLYFTCSASILAFGASILAF